MFRVFREREQVEKEAGERTAILTEQASTDALTGIANRRVFDAQIRRDWAISERTQRPLSLILIDVDYFKQFNDQHGHLEGDDCLRAVADVLVACVKRPGDVVARYGGEEFAVILSDTDATGAQRVAENVRCSVEALAIQHGLSEVAAVVAVSTGTATTEHVSTGELIDLVRAADTALYEAKAAGRNLVTCVAV